MKRYLFLDIDGVLNTDRHRQRLAVAGRPLRDQLGPCFDPLAVANLQSIVAATDADIVITSSWRLQGEDVMNRAWCQRRMPGILVGVTPVVGTSYYCIRGMEILRWIAENTADGEQVRYVIIDDCNDFLPEQTPLLVRTNPFVGLTASDAQRAIRILMGNN